MQPRRGPNQIGTRPKRASDPEAERLYGEVVRTLTHVVVPAHDMLYFEGDIVAGARGVGSGWGGWIKQGAWGVVVVRCMGGAVALDPSEFMGDQGTSASPSVLEGV